VVDGLQTGDAAPDDEQITMDSLYRYLARRAQGSATTPQRFIQGGVGDLVISANPLAGASQIDQGIVEALADERYMIRLGAVTELDFRIGENGFIAARAARLLLQRSLLQERDYLVRQAITKALAKLQSAPAESGRLTQKPSPSIAVRVPSRDGEDDTRPTQIRDSAVADFAVFRDTPFSPELVVIPAGEFMMGSTGEEDAYVDERPQHQVTISQRFAIGRYPVTFTEYDRFCDAEGRNKPKDEDWGRGRRPVININWEEASAFVTWLSQETGRSYRLPTEAEWEYACRAGTKTRYSFGEAIAPADANYAISGLNRTIEVGSYRPNRWGLHDMHGNVFEWVEDHWHNNFRGAPTDGSAWLDAGAAMASGLRVLRGGSWYVHPRHCRSANRYRESVFHRTEDVGFRVARTLSYF
jgi:formylglycine-generating enzyme required for sulfatase activity